jgi:hypothetical protein
MAFSQKSSPYGHLPPAMKEASAGAMILLLLFIFLVVSFA